MVNRAIDQFRPGARSHPLSSQEQWVPSLDLDKLSLDGSSMPQPELMATAGESRGGSDPGSTDSPVPDEIPIQHVSIDAIDATGAQGDLDRPSEDIPGIPELTQSPASKPHQRIARRTASQLMRSARVVGIPLVWAGVIAFCGGTGYAAFSWLSTIPPAPSCDRIWWFSLDADKLFCAEQAVRSGDEHALVAGLALVKNWTDNHPLHKKSTGLRQQWSKALLGIARQKALHNDLNTATQLAQEIPPGSPVYKEAQTAIASWKTTTEQFKSLGATVEEALKTQNWQKAEQPLQGLAGKGDEYQQQQHDRLRERVIMERIARTQLQQLQDLIKKTPDDPVTLGQAVRLAAQISPRSYAWKDAQDSLQDWSQALVEIAIAQLEQGHINAAIAAAEAVPQSMPLPTDLRDLLWLNRARQLSGNPPATATPVTQLWQLTQAQAAVQQIPPNSRFYDQAQPILQPLAVRLQDLTQLNLAAATASLQQIPSLQLAIQLAQAIARDHPDRLYAQTLIAQWRKDIQRAEDRPYLVAAQRIAQLGKIPDLKTAIAQAGRIPLGRALRPEAQAAIFDWQQQIQTLEDKPYLDRARALAQQKKLPQAIASAAKILPDRALYPAAQDAIQHWTDTLQLAEDKPILGQAEALANQGSLGAAIDTAYQIAPGRALYEDAQQAIARWSAQLAATEHRRSRLRGTSNATEETAPVDRGSSQNPRSPDSSGHTTPSEPSQRAPEAPPP